MSQKEIERKLPSINDAMFYPFTYSGSAEVKGSAITTLDFGSVNIATADSQSAEKAIAFGSSQLEDKFYKGKIWGGFANFPGFNIVAETIAALSEALNAGATRESYAKLPGRRTTALPLVWKPTENATDRLKAQIQIDKAPWGNNPFDYAKDTIKVPGTINIYFEIDEYKRRIDVSNALDTKFFAQLGVIEFNVVLPGGYERTIGYLEDGVTYGMAQNTVQAEVGNPKIVVLKAITSRTHTLKATLSVVEPYALSLLSQYPIQEKNGEWNIPIVDNTSQIYTYPVILRGWYAGGVLIEYTFDNCQFQIEGDISYFNQQSKLGFTATPLPDMDGKVGEINIGNNVGALYKLDTVFKVAVV